jgi:hypothetical protein
MQAEGEGHAAEARDLFLQAWAAQTDDFEACIAAHYVARHQPTPEETLRWNELALSHAERVGDERVRGFYSSLYLNLGYSHEVLGHEAEARRLYALAADHANDLPNDAYAAVVRNGLEGAKQRLGTDK